MCVILMNMHTVWLQPNSFRMHKIFRPAEGKTCQTSKGNRLPKAKRKKHNKLPLINNGRTIVCVCDYVGYYTLCVFAGSRATHKCMHVLQPVNARMADVFLAFASLSREQCDCFVLFPVSPNERRYTVVRRHALLMPGHAPHLRIASHSNWRALFNSIYISIRVRNRMRGERTQHCSFGSVFPH